MDTASRVPPTSGIRKSPSVTPSPALPLATSSPFTLTTYADGLSPVARMVKVTRSPGPIGPSPAAAAAPNPLSTAAPAVPGATASAAATPPRPRQQPPAPRGRRAPHRRPPRVTVTRSAAEVAPRHAAVWPIRAR